MIRGNTSDIIGHPPPKDFIFAHGASHHAWAPGPLPSKMCLRTRLASATSICCCSNIASPLSQTTRHSSRSLANSPSLAQGILHLLKDELMWSLKRCFRPPPSEDRRVVHCKVDGENYVSRHPYHITKTPWLSSEQ